MVDVQKAIRMAVDTGTVLLGKNESIRSVVSGKSKMVVYASNINDDLKVYVKKMGDLSGVPVYMYDGSSKELGSICGKPYPVSVLSVIDEGDSDILELAVGEKKGGKPKSKSKS